MKAEDFSHKDLKIVIKKSTSPSAKSLAKLLSRFSGNEKRTVKEAALLAFKLGAVYREPKSKAREPEREAYLKQRLRIYCAASFSFFEAKEYLEAVLSMLDVKGVEEFDDLSEEQLKARTYFQMAVICYIRPFTNKHFRLDIKSVPEKFRDLKDRYNNYRNDFVAHNDDLSDIVEDVLGLFPSQFRVDIINDPEKLALDLGGDILIPRSRSAVEDLDKLVSESQKGLRVMKDKLFKKKEIVEILRSFPTGSYRVNPELGPVLKKAVSVRFSYNDEHKLEVVPKQLYAPKSGSQNS